MKGRVTSAHVIAVIALVAALGGGAYAANQGANKAKQSFQFRKVKVIHADVSGGDTFDFTPSVKGLSTLVIDTNVPSVMGDVDGRVFTKGKPGQVLTLVSEDEQIILTDSTKVDVATGAWSGDNGDSITFTLADGKWREMSRSNNG